MKRSPYLLWLVEAVLLLLGARQVWAVASVMALRVDYPGDIEWMEGGTLVSALRVLQGKPIHADPTLDYIPFIYPPLYAWIVGGLGHFFSFGYALARSVSITGFALSCLALVYGARQAGARWPLAIAIGCMFVGTYDDCAAFYDLVRVDSVTLGFLSWALVLGAGKKRGQLIASGILLAGAFAAKHNTAAFGLPMIIGIYRRSGRKDALTFLAASAVPALVFLVEQEISTGGQFLQWILGVPARHGIVAARLITGAGFTAQSHFWKPWEGGPLIHLPFSLPTPGAQFEFWLALPWTTTAALLLPGWFRRGSEALYWTGVALIGLVICSLMRGHVGGFINVLIPMYWIMSLWPALQLPVWQARWGTPEGGRIFSRVPASAAPVVMSLVVAGQLWGGYAALDRFIPTEKDREEVTAFVESLRELPEPILCPAAPYALVLAGKEPSFSLISLWDIDYKGGPYRPFVRQVEKAMKTQYWASAVLPDDKLGYGLKTYYERHHFMKAPAPKTRVGWGVRLNQVWVPRAQVGTEPEVPESEERETEGEGGSL